MFSSLEALDADDSLNAAPVVRLGAFQPKAKPRARKGASTLAGKPSSLPSASAPIPVHVGRPTHDAGVTGGGSAHVDATSSPVIAGDECQGRKLPVTSGDVEVVAEAPVSIASFQEISSRDANGPAQLLLEGDTMGSLTTALHNAPSASASRSFGRGQSTWKKHEPRRQSHSQADKGEDTPLELAGEETSLYTSHVSDSFAVGVDSHESEVVAPLKRMDITRTESLDEAPMEVNEESVVERDKPAETIKFAICDESVVANASQAEESADKTKVANATAQEAGTENPVALVKKKKKKEKREPGQSEEMSKDIENVSADMVNEATLKKVKKARKAAIFTATASANASQPVAEVANEGSPFMESAQEASVWNAIQIAKRKKSSGKNAIENDQEALVCSSIEIAKRNSNDAEEYRDMSENTSPQTAPTSCLRATNKRMTKKPAKFDDGADDDLVRAFTEESLEPSEKRKKVDSNKVCREEDATDNDLLITFVKEKAKGKKSHFASFSATMPERATVADDAVGKSASLGDEKEQQKKFKKSLPSRRRVERRLMNPADPDLDPKKMTMKDIIRLAEAKERMLKNGDSKKPKDGNNPPPAHELEKEDDTLESSHLAPQVQIIDGRIVINQESLVVNAHPKDDIRTYTRVEETHSKLNYHSYMRRTPKLKWRKDETDLFYEALREFGTNFSMIQHLFPGRTRKQVLLKYKKEEKSCPLRICEAMRVKPCDSSHFVELMSSMNLLPSKMPDALEGPVDPYDDMTFSTEEAENSNDMRTGPKGHAMDHTSKLEELPMQIEGGEKCEIDNTNPWISEAAVTVIEPAEKRSEDAPQADEKVEASESPIKAASPPRKKKSLFSYQMVATTKS